MSYAASRRSADAVLSAVTRALAGLDDATVRAAGLTLAGRRPGWRGVLPFLGPAFIASVAYVDPGNFATNIQSGAAYGYLLLWVVMASNLIAMLVQALAAKLGIATGSNLAEVCRDQFPRPVVWALWAVAEIGALATDLAEILGAAIGLQLLFGLPLLTAGFLTIVATFAILGFQHYGFRPLEAVITVLVGVIAVCYVVETLLVAPDWGQIAVHAVVPHLAGADSVLLAVGILGATVMPHVIFLHSHLTQGRIHAHDDQEVRRIFRFEVVDVVLAMTVAGLVNAAILIMAAATLNTTGQGGDVSLEVAYQTLTPLFGTAASLVFAISLLASGLSSSAVGTLAGQVIMQGYVKRSIPLWVRRSFTMLPAVVVIALGLDPTRMLIVSQVFLSFCLPFALVPLVLFTRRRDLMGGLANGRLTNVMAVGAVTLIVALNLFLLYQLVPQLG